MHRTLLVLALATPLVPAQDYSWVLQESPREDLSAFFGDATAVATADLDGNGRPDAVFARAGELRVALNFGDGVFETSTLADRSLGWIRLVDMDGDRDRDVLYMRRNSSTSRHELTYAVNNGKGELSAGPWAIGLSWTSLDASDIDGDGDVDIVVGRAGQNQLFLNDGKGKLTEATTRLPVIRDNTKLVRLADIDRDRDVDLVVLNEREPHRVWLNDGAGFFGTEVKSAIPASISARQIEFVDVDADGVVEMLALPSTVLLENNGKGTFSWTSGRMPAVGGWSMAVGDYDGDKSPDVFVGVPLGIQGGQDRMLINDGKGSFVDRTATMLGARSETVTSVAAADIDLDGFDDIWVAVGLEWGVVRRVANHWLRNDKGRRLVRGSEVVRDGALPSAWHASHAVGLEDLDSDGDLDLVIGTNFNEQNRCYFNDGTGHFTDVTERVMPKAEDSTNELVFANVDGKPGNELITANWGGVHVRIYSWDGQKFSVMNSGITATGQGNALVVGDVDGNQDLDLIVGEFGASNSLYLNDGKGGFVDASSNLWPVIGNTTDLALGDLDGDGDLDLIEVSPRAKTVVYVNDGKGNFKDISPQLGPAHGLSSVAVGDLDNDGDLDVYGGVENSYIDGFVFENLGKLKFGSLGLPKLRRVAPDSSKRAVITDIDGDLDLDIVVAAWTDATTFQWESNGENRIFVNEGKWKFTLQQLPNHGDHVRRTGAYQRGDPSAAIAVADLDNDGDVDYLVCNWKSQSFVHFNRMRHASVWPWIRVGRSFDLEMHSVPYGGAVPPFLTIGLLGTGTTAIPLAPLGTLRVDPVGLVVLPAALTGSLGGPAKVTIPVPNDAKLVGATLWFQAVVEGRDANRKPTLRLTNHVRETVLR